LVDKPTPTAVDPQSVPEVPIAIPPAGEDLPGPKVGPAHSNRRRASSVVIAVLILAVILSAGLAELGDLPRIAPSGGAPAALALSIRAAPSAGYAPFSVRLSAEIEGGTAPYSVSWSLPGGASATGASTDLFLPTAGNYTVGATVADAAGTSAAATLVVVSVSPLPGAEIVVPAPSGDPNVVLAITWTSSSSVSSCVLPGWGFSSVPSFEGCTTAGGVTHVGSSGAGRFPGNPDDPEATPALFQSTQSGIAIDLSWWYNTTSGVESSGTVDGSTAVAPL
jgi:hypothetical protein